MIDQIYEQELAALRSGRDEHSSLKLPALTVMKPNEAAVIADVAGAHSTRQQEHYGA
jgi:hypothetical protein